MPRRRAQLDWTMRHGPIFGPVNAAAAVLATTSIVQVAHFDTVRVGLAALIITAGGLCAATLRRHDTPRTMLAYWILCGLAAQCFMLWVVAVQPRIIDAGTVFGAGTLTASILYAALWTMLRAHPDEPTAQPSPPPTSGLEAAIVRVLGDDVTTSPRQPGDYGYAIPVHLPATGRLTLRDVGTRLDSIATAARLPDTINLTAEKSGTSGIVLIRATDAANLAAELPLPPAAGPRSILDPFGVGLRLDGGEAQLRLAEKSARFVGPSRKGKTTLLHTCINHIAHSTNAVGWLADLGKQAKIGAQWNRPFLDGETDWPVLDWTVSTVPEARTMLRAFLAEIRHRAAGPGREVEKMTPTPEHPAIVLMIEEGPDLVKDPIALGMVVDAARTGLEYCCHVIFLTQRPTLSMTGSNDHMTQMSLTVGFAGKDLPQTFDFNPLVRASALPHKGCFYVLDEDESPDPYVVKGYRTAWDDIPKLARSATPYRPRLDNAAVDLSESGLIKLYTKRWGGKDDLAEAYMRRWVPAEVTAGSSDGPVKVINTGTGNLAADLDAIGIGRAVQPRQPADGSLDAQFAAVLADAGLDEDAAADRIPEALSRVAAIFARPGIPDRLHTSMILAELGNPALTARKLSDLLKLVGVTPLPEAFWVGQDRFRGYTRASVHGAVALIRDGRFTPPAAAFEWPEPADPDHREP